MFHRILTFSLAAILVLETPLTAYAAQTTSVQMEESVGEMGTEGKISEIGEESGKEDEYAEIPDQESGNPEDEGKNPQEPAEPVTGDGGQESKESGADAETPQEPEPGEAMEEPEQQEEEKNETQEPGDTEKEEELPGEPADNLPEEEVPPVDDEVPEQEITVSENSVSENTLSAAAFSARVSEEATVKPLSFEKASGEGEEITLPPSVDGTSNYVWYSFTAPKAGRYAFYTEEAVFDSLSDSVYFYLCTEPDKSTMIQNGTPQKGVSLCTSTNYMEEGETLYIGTWTSKTDGEITYILRAAYQTAFTKNADGSYTASLPEGDSVTLRTIAGKSRYQLVVESASQKQYRLNNFYCPSDHSEWDTFNKTIDDVSRQDYQLVSDILPGGSYETVCMITCSTLENKFVALLTGMEPLTIEGADSDDIVYVHNDTCEEHSIALEMESLVRDDHDLELWCYNAKSGEKMGEMLVNPWMTYEFDRLEADTEYRFDIRDLWGEQILKSMTYRTKAPSEVIEDVTAEISSDFSKLTVRVKPSWQGTADRRWLRWKMTDSLGRECEKSQQVSLNKRDEEGYFTVEIGTAANGICLQPGAVYSIQISMEFESAEETVYTAAKTVSVKAPGQAFLQESDITFKVKQDGWYTEEDQKGRPKVTVTVEVPETAGIANAGYFYRPVNEGQKYVSDYLQLEAGKAEQSISLYLDQVGLDFEFILSVGGITKKETLGIEHELGLRLNRVEASTDETGPFHFVRTYKITGKEQLTGTYYLQLQMLPKESGSSQIYIDRGKAVELNQGNGYQATVSTLDVGWVPEPDIDYRLRWVLSKTETVSYNENLLAVAYESVHTGKPHIKLERLNDSSWTSQRHRVTLGEEDIAVLKKFDKGVSLYSYIRENNEAAAYTKGSLYELTPDNNYSDIKPFSGLKADTEYEFSLRDRSGEKIYVTDVFRTAKDTRTVAISKTEIYFNKVNLHYTLNGFDNYSNDYVVCWYRQAGIIGEWKKSNAWLARKDNYFTLPALKENTAYEYAVGIGRQNDEVPWLEKTVRGSITTKTDTRRIEVSYKSRMTSSSVTCKMSDMGVADNNTVIFFLREKGQEAWEKKVSKMYRENEAIETFSLEGLKEDTAYEYRVGFVENDSATANDLKRGTEGELKTAEDLRSVEAAPEPKAFSAKIRYTLSDMEGADDGYLLGYLKKSSEVEDSAWEKVFTVETGEKAAEDAFVLEELEDETAYELTMGFGTEENTARVSLRRAKTFSFTTMTDSRSLSDAQAEVGDDSVILRVKFSGNLENRNSYVHFFYRVKGETEYQKAGRIVNMSGVEEETAAVTLIGLLKQTEYEFAAVLTGGTTCGKPEDVTREAYKAFGSFTTPEAIKPAILKISHGQLYLNANALYKNEKGFGYENLKVQWEPLEADSDLVWKSSDETVAKVTEDGQVSAVAAGKATITAASLYEPEVSVSCEVTVCDYQIGRKGADGSISIVEDARLNVARGVSCEGYVLCSTVSESPVEVSALEVTSGNESIVQWTDGVIETKRAGETRLVFTSEADHVKAFLTVAVQPSMGKGFAITGFKADASSYPALKEDAVDEAGREQYTMAYRIMSNGESIFYTAVGEIMPARPGFDSGDFNWSIDDPEVATVNEKGTVMPKKAGDAVLRVEPKNADDTALYKTQVCEVALHIKAVPPYDSRYVPFNTNKNPLYLYVLENTYKKLGDVKFPEGWEGWKWKYPDTPLVINGENRSYYSFRAVYEGESYYPYETSIGVKIGRVTGITASEAEGGDHNNVLEVGSVDSEGNPAESSDSLILCVESLFNGDIDYNESLNYTWKVEMNAPAGLVIKEGTYSRPGNGRLQMNYTVTAVKKGNYTLTPVIKVTDPKTNREKVLSKTSFKIQAVEEKQAYIALEPAATTGITTEEGRIVADAGGSVKNFQICALLLDREKKEVETFEKVKLTWSSSDNKVVTVKASKDTHSAEVKIVGEGHAILTAKVKDKAGHTATARVEIRNLAPRVDVSKVTVNPAYDYDSPEGRRLAFENAGAVEVVPVYSVVKYGKVSLWKSDKETLETDLKLIEYEEGGKYCYLVCATDSVEEKVYDCYLGVESSGLLSEPFFHPLKVTVKTKQPQVTVRSVRPSNLFYRTDPASVDIGTAQKGVVIESVRWIDNAEGENGFSSDPSDYKFDTVKKGNNVERLYFEQGNIRLTDGKKLEEPGIVSGKVEIRCKGYREALESPVTLKWNYKKPAIVVKEKEATLIPALDGHLKGSFLLYNGEKERLLFKNSSAGTDDPRTCYNELIFHNKDFVKSSFRDYTYVGSKMKGSEKLTMTIVSDYWREPLSAVHTVKFANPTPYLTKAKLVLNTGTTGTAYTDIELKNAYTAALTCDDIIIEGKNAKSQALLDEDLLEMEQKSAGSNRIVVRLNRAQTMRQEIIKNGTYDFKVTPCFRDASGNRIEGKTLTLKIQATNKAVTAKVKLSGSLDLSKKPDKVSGTDTVKNYVDVRTTLQNIGDNYSYDNRTGLSLIGEYSNYFSVSFFDSVPGLYRIRINKNNESKLKAGQRYRLAICFTLKMENGDTVQVQTPTFTVRPKQSVPKVTVHGNTQTLFAGNDKLIRTCGFELPDGMGYRIKGISGGLDCNKDGKQDISISWVKKDSTDQYAAAELKLADRDGALTVSGANGKTYSIPVIITLEGRDGISKDVKTSIKVTVRR